MENLKRKIKELRRKIKRKQIDQIIIKELQKAEKKKILKMYGKEV